MNAERTLRLLAGFMVLLTLSLGFWWNHYFYLGTALVGFNLLQSAFTNWCPAMWLLQKFGQN